MSPFGTSLLRSDSVAFGCEADMRTVDRSNQSDVNDPGCVKTLEAFVGAQQKNRTCGLSESFMRGRHSVRIYLLPERPAKGFSRSQDPTRTLAAQFCCAAQPSCCCARLRSFAQGGVR